MYYCLGFVADVAQTFGREHRVLRTPNCSLVVGNCLSRIRSGFQERMRSWRILASLPIRRISRRSTWKRFEFGKASPSSASSWKIPKSSGLYDALRGPYSPLLLCICIINEEWPGSITTKVRLRHCSHVPRLLSSRLVTVAVRPMPLPHAVRKQLNKLNKIHPDDLIKTWKIIRGDKVRVA